MYACGLRIGEATTLSVASVDSQAMLLRHIGKRNRERVVPINPDILKLLRETWKIYRNPKRVFSRPNGLPISDSSLARVIRAAREQCGFGCEFTSHVLRHSFATRLLEQGVPIETIQLLLGHGSRRSTQIYLHLTKPLQNDIRGRINTFINDLFTEGGSQ
jgi:site-specific recombinase XerD